MKEPLLDNIPDFEVAYLQMKKNLYVEFFKIMTGLFFIPLLVETARAFIDMKTSILPTLITAILVTGTLVKIIWSLKQYQELGMTIFCFGSCAFLLAVNYADPQGYFLDPLNSFYFGYGMCSFERLILSRIPYVWQRNLFRVAIVLTGLFIITPTQLSPFVMQTVHTISGVYFDMEAKKRDKALFRSYFNFRSQFSKFKDLVVRDIPDSIAIVTQDMKKCLFINDSFQTLFHHSSESDIWKLLKHFKLQDDPLQNQSSALPFLSFIENVIQKWNQNLLREKCSCNLTYSSHNKITLFEAKIIPTVWDDQNAVAITLHDITEQRTILNLRLADAQKDALLTTVSHELRTPLNGIMGMVQVLQKKLVDPELLHYLSICKNSGNLLMALVNSILDMNQIRANTIKLYPERISLVEFLDEVTKLFEVQCAQKNLYLKRNVSPGMGEKHIFTDKNRLCQILINLIGNSLKFTKKGGIEITVSDSDHHDEYIEFSVIDTGIGIKNEDKGKLFKMFGKLEETTTRENNEGAGLGLTISNALAKLLCKDSGIAGIQLQSSFGEGSNFSFLIQRNLLNTPRSNKNRPLLTRFPSSTNADGSEMSSEDFESVADRIACYSLPFVKGSLIPTCLTSQTQELSPNSRLRANRSIKSASSMGNLEPFKLKKERSSPASRFCNVKPEVLIVDDNSLNLIIGNYLVSSHGFNVHTALSGQIAIDLLTKNDYEKNPISLIMMDLQMPDMDGYQTTRNLKRLIKCGTIPDIPIVAFTANDREEDRRACKEAGMVGFLSKPIKELELVKILNTYANRIR